MSDKRHPTEIPLAENPLDESGERGLDDDIIRMPIDGTLDLHTFSPREIKTLIPDYLAECLKENIFEVRIVHGKGKGVLRRIVHSALDRIPYVESYHTAGHQRGSWGATIVHLQKNTR